MDAFKSIPTFDIINAMHTIGHKEFQQHDVHGRFQESKILEMADALAAYIQKNCGCLI